LAVEQGADVGRPETNRDRAGVAVVFNGCDQKTQQPRLLAWAEILPQTVEVSERSPGFGFGDTLASRLPHLLVELADPTVNLSDPFVVLGKLGGVVASPRTLGREPVQLLRAPPSLLFEILALAPACRQFGINGEPCLGYNLGQQGRVVGQGAHFVHDHAFYLARG